MGSSPRHCANSLTSFLTGAVRRGIATSITFLPGVGRQFAKSIPSLLRNATAYVKNVRVSRTPFEKVYEVRQHSIPMHMNNKSPASSLTPSDSSPRNPRVHRQTGIPSISRQRSSSTLSFGTGHGKDGIGGHFSETLGTIKKTAHHLLSKTPDAYDHTPSSRRRFASMPPPQVQPSPTISSNAVHGRAAVSPPIIDFTTFEDTYRGTRMGNFEGLMARRSRGNTARIASEGATKPAPRTPATPSSGAKSIPLTGVPLSASVRKPDPRLILSSLENVLGTSQDVDEYLNAHDLLAMHQLDQVDFDDRDRIRANLINNGTLEVHGRKGALAVLGEPIRKASIYSSTSMVLAGREHELPIIVVNTVEELYRTGIYQSNLFRTLPNRSRLLELIDIYDSEHQPPGSIIRSRQPSSHRPIPNAGFGSHTSLHLESTPDICALLTTYLSSLPEPIIPPWLFRALWDWCELDDEDTEGMQCEDSFGPRISHIPLARTYTSPTESTHILVAQLLLQLLPSPNFSLLVYLLAFFSQAALVREENGVGVADLSRMFGGRIFGGGPALEAAGGASSSDKNGAGRSAVDTRRTGETMMSWFLRRWGPLSEGLFDVVDDAKMGIFHRPVARRDSLGKDVLPSWPTSDPASSASEEESQSSSPAERYPVRQGGGNTPESRRGSFYDDDQRTPLPRIHLDGVPLHSTPNGNAKGRTRADPFEPDYGDFVVLSPMPAEDVPNETLDITQLPSRIHEDVTRVSSTAALDERLMDISIPTLLNQTLPTSQPDPFTAEPQRPRRPSKHVVDREVQTMRAHPIELVHALQLTAHLEDQLEERTTALTEALKELTKSKLTAAKLHGRLRALEKESSRISERTPRRREDGLGREDGVAAEFQRELDATIDMVSEIR